MPEPQPMTNARNFTKVDADRILRRAAEIEGADGEKRMSLAELRQIAGEAGFAAHTVERAIADVRAAGLASTTRAPVKKSGLVRTHVSTSREIAVGLDSDELMRVVRLFQPYREGPAQVRLEEHEISWRDRKGMRFSVTSVAGVTVARVYVSGFVLRRRRWVRWVQAAADRLEMLVLLVAGQQPSGGDTVHLQLPP